MLETRERPLLVEAVQGRDQPLDGFVLEADVEAQLRQSCYPAVRRVTCRLHDGVLTLRGRVSSYYLKQIAQTLAHDRLRGAARVHNALDVVPPEPSGPHRFEADAGDA
jgi:hypothetical protein